MAIIINGVVQRNIPEQVGKNKKDIASLNTCVESVKETADNAWALSQTNETDIGVLDGQVAALETGKQDKLTEGTGINISSSNISVDTSEIQEKLTAGTNITIVDNVISASGGGDDTLELIETITMTETAQVVRSTEPDSTPYNLKRLIIFSTNYSGSTSRFNIKLKDNLSLGAISIGEMGARSNTSLLLDISVKNGVVSGTLSFQGTSPTWLFHNGDTQFRYNPNVFNKNIGYFYSEGTITAGTVLKIYGVRG